MYDFKKFQQNNTIDLEGKTQLKKDEILDTELTIIDYSSLCFQFLKVNCTRADFRVPQILDDKLFFQLNFQNLFCHLLLIWHIVTFVIIKNYVLKTMFMLR